jgi:hypothetical protein
LNEYYLDNQNVIIYVDHFLYSLYEDILLERFIILELFCLGWLVHNEVLKLLIISLFDSFCKFSGFFLGDFKTS